MLNQISTILSKVSSLKVVAQELTGSGNTKYESANNALGCPAALGGVEFLM